MLALFRETNRFCVLLSPASSLYSLRMGNKQGQIEPSGDRPGYATASGRFVAAREANRKPTLRKKSKKETRKDKLKSGEKRGAVLASLGKGFQKDDTVYEGRRLDTIRDERSQDEGGSGYLLSVSTNSFRSIQFPVLTQQTTPYALQQPTQNQQQTATRSQLAMTGGAFLKIDIDRDDNPINADGSAKSASDRHTQRGDVRKNVRHPWGSGAIVEETRSHPLSLCIITKINDAQADGTLTTSGAKGANATGDKEKPAAVIDSGLEYVATNQELGISDDKRSFVPTTEEITAGKIQDVENVLFEKKLSEGAFGEVYMAKYRDKPCAIKKLKKEDATNMESFQREVRFMMKLKVGHISSHRKATQNYRMRRLTTPTPLSQHRNIIKFEGFCIDPVPLIVLQFAARGDLGGLLAGDPFETGYTFKRGFHIMKDVGRAMRYLHNRDVIHRDLKSGNIFVQGKEGNPEDWMGKLGDFGEVRARLAAFVRCLMGMVNDLR